MNRSNLWLLHFYTIAETVILLWFFGNIIVQARIRGLIHLLMIVFPIGCILNVWLFQKANVFNSNARSAEALIFIFLSACYWLEDNDGPNSASWVDNPANWMVSGLILYFASDFLLFLFSNRLLADAQAKHDYTVWYLVWGIHGTMVLLMYLLIAVGFFTIKPDRKGEYFFK